MRTSEVTTRSKVILFVGAVLLVAAGCGGSADSPSEVSSDAAASEVSAVLTGSYETIDGSQIDLGSLEGQDVVLWFWAPW